MRAFLLLCFALVANIAISQTYGLGTGTFVLEDVPASHPIAFHNFDVLEFQYTGQYFAGSQIGPDGVKHSYFHGDITIFVTGDFGTMNYSCANHGYMGGDDPIIFSFACSDDYPDVPIGPDVECITSGPIGVYGGEYAFSSVSLQEPRETQCPIDEPDYLTEEEKALIEPFNRAIRNYLNSNQARSAFRQNQTFYIPVVFRVISTYNMWPRITGSGFDIKSEEHADWVLDKINQYYNTSEGYYDYQDEGASFINPDYQNPANIIFIKATQTPEGTPIDWHQNHYIEDLQADLPPIDLPSCGDNEYRQYWQEQTPGAWYYNYSGPGTSETSTYYGYDFIWTTSSSCLGIISESQDLVDLVGFEEENYLNLFALAAGLGLTNGWASLPYQGSRCFFDGNTYAAANATLPHEIGHWLGLSHTFGPIYNGANSADNCYNSTMCADRYEEWITPGACEISGDYVCDTWPTDQDWDRCYSYAPGTNGLSPTIKSLCKKTEPLPPTGLQHCNMYLDMPPTNIDTILSREEPPPPFSPSGASNNMDYTQGCDQEGFTEGQYDRIRAALITEPLRIGAAETGYALANLDPSLLCGDPTSCTYYENGTSTSPDHCLYDDAIGECGGDCASDANGNGICDDDESDICTVGDLNGNGICDDIDPCGTLSTISGMVSTPGLETPVISLGNRCWSLVDLNRFTFQNGDVIATPTDPTDNYVNRNTFASAGANGEPMFASLPLLEGEKESNNYQVLDESKFNQTMYNWYAVSDPRGLCPSGWHVSTDDDWKDLERALGMPENQITRYSRSANFAAYDSLDLVNFVNFYVNQQGVVTEDALPLPTGGVNKKGQPYFVGNSKLFWTADDIDYGTTKNNALFRQIRTNWGYFSEPGGSIRAFEQSGPAINRLFQLGFTSGNKSAGMSVRCVKDVN